jgi:hypothetical protein
MTHAADELCAVGVVSLADCAWTGCGGEKGDGSVAGEEGDEDEGIAGGEETSDHGRRRV